MKTKTLPEPNQVQKTCEAFLKWSIPGIAFYHLGLILAGYFLADSVTTTLLAAEKWALIIIVGIALLYCVYTMFALHEQMFRIKQFLRRLCCPEMILLILFFVWNIFCVISADKTYKYNFWKANDAILFDLFVSFFMFFAFAYILTKQQAKKTVEILFLIIVAVTTGLMIWVLWVVCKPSVIELPGGVSIGMTSNGRLSVNCHPNTVGAYAEIVLMMCLYMAVTKKRIIRFLNLLAIPVHYFVLILTDSRTCLIATAFTVGVVIGKLVFDAAKGKSSWQRALFASLSFVICFVAIMGLRQPVRIAYESISHFSELVSGGTAITGRTMEMTTNGRLELWYAAVQSAFSSFRNMMFGVTPAGVVSEINKWTGKDLNYYTHNQFFEVLVSNGLPGFLLFVSWLVLIARKCIKNVLLRMDITRRDMVVVCGMILMLVISNLYEAILLYYRFLVEGLFFLFCGMIAYEGKDNKEQPQKKSGIQSRKK